jgi:hypothetical protein
MDKIFQRSEDVEAAGKGCHVSHSCDPIVAVECGVIRIRL